MSRHVKLLAAVTVVLLALSGFSPARSGGSGGKSSSSSRGGGGGCSSAGSASHSSQTGSDSSYSGGGSGHSGGNRQRSPHSSVSECAAATSGKPYSEVRVKSDDSSYRTFTVVVDFLDEQGAVVDTGRATARVPGGRTKTVTVRMERPSAVSMVENCRVRSVR
ncbi:hypothetical protein HCC30_28155 [Streptomyces sp. HNM0574]|nr:hypothetical protein [Streptomyces sp. HNM0574]